MCILLLNFSNMCLFRSLYFSSSNACTHAGYMTISASHQSIKSKKTQSITAINSCDIHVHLIVDNPNPNPTASTIWPWFCLISPKIFGAKTPRWQIVSPGRLHKQDPVMWDTQLAARWVVQYRVQDYAAPSFLAHFFLNLSYFFCA